MDSYSAKHLIVTADDFGLSETVNETIVHAFLRGIVTGASAVVGGVSASHAAKLAQNVRMPVGLHLDLVQGNVEENEDGLFGQEGYLHRLLKSREGEEKFFLPKAMVDKVFRQFWLQLCAFRAMFKQEPDRLSYHGTIHMFPQVFDAYRRFSAEEGIPFRFQDSRHGYRDIVLDTRLQHGGLPDILEGLGDVTEVSIHPPHDIEILTSETLQQEIEKRGIKLISFRQLKEQ